MEKQCECRKGNCEMKEKPRRKRVSARFPPLRSKQECPFTNDLMPTFVRNKIIRITQQSWLNF